MSSNSSTGTMSFPISGIESSGKRQQFMLYLDQIEEITSYELSEDNSMLFVEPNFALMHPTRGMSNEVRAHSTVESLVAEALTSTLVYLHTLAR